MVGVNPLPNKVMQWSLEMWRRVLLGSEQVTETVTKTASHVAEPHTRSEPPRRDADAPPQIW